MADQLGFAFPDVDPAPQPPRPTRAERMTAYLARPRLQPKPPTLFDLFRIYAEEREFERRLLASLDADETDSEVVE